MDRCMSIGAYHRKLLEEKKPNSCPVKKYKLLWLLVALVVLSALALTWFPKTRFDSIIIHHSASNTDNYESIRRYHAKKGMGDAAYHLLLSNGSTEVPLGSLEATGRYATLSHALGARSIRHNLTGLHICIVGNYETGQVPDNIKPAIAHAIRGLQKKFGIPDSKLLFHRDIGQTKCPGKYFGKKEFLYWLRTLAGECPPSIAAQQDKVIESAGFSIGTAPVRQVVVLMAVLVFFSLGWIAVFHALSVRRHGKALSRNRKAERNRHPLLVGLVRVSCVSVGGASASPEHFSGQRYV
ncbi:MAG: N-acetylmuramoyl-L-alanine amidase [Desulfatibacillum sp.]|nr:N-acetylmuramoyl-L-alanine amidase [Desulfatibacillum sp.]